MAALHSVHRRSFRHCDSTSSAYRIMYGGGSEKAAGAFDFGAPVHFGQSMADWLDGSKRACKGTDSDLFWRSLTGSMFGPDSDDEGSAAQQQSSEPIYSVQTHAFPNKQVRKSLTCMSRGSAATSAWLS